VELPKARSIGAGIALQSHMLSAVTLFCYLMSSQTTAESAQIILNNTPSQTLHLDAMIIGTFQRIGLMADLRLRYRHSLYASDNVAFAENFVGAGFIEQASPVFSQTGAYLELQPATFFNISANYQWVGYFGAFNTLRAVNDCEGVQSMSADDPRCAFSSNSSAPNMSDYGHRVWVEAHLRGRIGPVIATDSVSVEGWGFRDGWAAGPHKKYWINEYFNLPQRQKDLVITNSGAVLYEVLKGHGAGNLHLLVGAMSSLAYATGTNYLTHRAGPVAILQLPKWHQARDLFAALMVQFYTHDRYTQGPIPFVGLALGMSTSSLFGT
jgi:hypothetical protein